MLEINIDNNAKHNFDSELSEVSFLYKKGDYVEAFSKGVMLQEKIPQNAILHNLIGASELALGDAKAAANSYSRAIESDPSFLGSYINLGSLYRSIGMKDEALAIYKVALKLNNNDPSLYFNIGNLLMDFDEHKMAQESFRKAIEINQGHLDAHYNIALSIMYQWKKNNSLGSTLYDLDVSDESLEQLDQAKGHLERAEMSNRKNAEYYQLLAEIQLKQKDFNNSEKNSKKAISIDSAYYNAYLNLARLKYMKRDFTGTVNLCNIALKIKPDLTSARIELALALFNLGKIDDAIGIFQEVLKLMPGKPDIIYNLSLALGAKGKYKEAWKIFPSRFMLGMDRANFEKFSVFPKWTGKQCKSLAVWQEQGVGDVIFFSSMLHDLQNKAQNITAFIDERLIELFKNSFPSINFTDKDSIIVAGDFDAQISFGDLTMFFRNRISDFPKHDFGYLIPIKKEKSKIETFIKENGKPVCGLAWFTKASQESDDRKIELDQLLSAFKDLDINLLNLRYPCANQKASEVPKKYSEDILTLPGIDLMNDFSAMSAMIANCDFVVTIDNTIAHLSSAIGKKTIVLLPAAPPNYRWMTGKRHTPWYPKSTILLRKQKVGDWSNVMSDLSDELKNLIKKV